MLAVSAENFSTGVKVDPRYIQFMATFVEYIPEEQKEMQVNYPMHICTEADFAKFHEPEIGQRSKITRLKNDNAWYCVDLESTIAELYGTWRSGSSYAAIKIDVRPCASRWTAADGKVYGGYDYCVWDQKEMQEYLGSNLNTLFLYNSGSFK